IRHRGSGRHGPGRRCDAARRVQEGNGGADLRCDPGAARSGAILSQQRGLPEFCAGADCRAAAARQGPGVTGRLTIGAAKYRYSTLILAARMTLLHFSASVAMNFPKSAGEPASAVAPKSASRAFISGSARTTFISLLSLSTISGGVLLGAATPNQLLASKPGRNSLTVGNCGRISERSGVVTANARSLPAFTCSIDDGVSANITCI